jgi:heptosyltransferase-1
MDLLRPLGLHEADPSLFVPVSTEDEAAATRYLGTELGPPGERFAALAMSTTFYHKHWPEEQVAGLVDRLFEGYGLRSVMLGSAKDLDSQRRVAQLARHAPVLAAGATSLTEAAAVMGRAEMVVAVDTGLLWIALAVRAPLVGIFGPTTYEHLADEAAEIACKPFPCAPCLRSATCEDRDCMRALSVDDAMAAVGRVMARTSTPQPVAVQG